MNEFYENNEKSSSFLNNLNSENVNSRLFAIDIKDNSKLDSLTTHCLSRSFEINHA